ncbi:butyrophilin-like protein 10 [Chaetodon trifascialis]|uniref:butyrophilin-like protein 10 n=1 Tax=Chaetodon trifascialis TaxID=109706 RepID=UPI003991AB7B
MGNPACDKHLSRSVATGGTGQYPDLKEETDSACRSLDSARGFHQLAVLYLEALHATFVSPGQHRLVCPTQPIEATEGDDVTLQCDLDPPVNVVNYTVDWKRTDRNEVVHSYRNKQENLQPQMEGRATLNQEDLRSGILRLQLSSLQPSDSGPYRCFVPKLWIRCNINLNIVRREQKKTKSDASSTARPPLVEVTGTKNPRPDGESRKPVHAGTVASVVLFVVLFVVLGVSLLITGIKQNCMKRLKGREDKEPETAENGLDMQQLNPQAAEGDEDLERAAENGLRSIVCFR